MLPLPILDCSHRAPPLISMSPEPAISALSCSVAIRSAPMLPLPAI